MAIAEKVPIVAILNPEDTEELALTLEAKKKRKGHTYTYKPKNGVY